MLIKLAIIGLLCIVLWMVTKRRESMFEKINKPKTPDWFNKSIVEWKAAINTISGATSKADAIKKIKAARDSKPKLSIGRSIFTGALIKANNSSNVNQIVSKFKLVISGLEKSKNNILTKWSKSKGMRQLMLNEQLADAKKYNSVSDFVAAYQKKVSDLMVKKTTSTFKGEENLTDAQRIEMYQKAINDMQKAGSIDAFVNSRKGILSKVRMAGRKMRAKASMKKSGGNYYFYFNSVK